MAFREINFKAVEKSNSKNSEFLLNLLEKGISDEIKSESARQRSCTFAPSCLRCRRKSWFRLRGTTTDIVVEPDLGLDFRAKVGTARHKDIQKTLSSVLDADWIEVEDYLSENPIPYKYELRKSDYETQVYIPELPVKFAVDGIIRINGKIYLLEIKTSEYAAFESLTKEKDVHRDQIICYSAILGIHSILFLYEDRTYGEHKSYETYISDVEHKAIIETMNEIKAMADMNIAPKKLQNGDYMCKNCEYKKKCMEW